MEERPQSSMVPTGTPSTLDLTTVYDGARKQDLTNLGKLQMDGIISGFAHAVDCAAEPMRQ